GSYSYNGNSSVVVPAGIYGGGISITGNPPNVTFNAGNYGNGINLNGNLGDVTFNPGQYQSDGRTHGGPAACSGGSFDGSNDDSICISGNATVTFNSGSYTFYGP